MDNIVAKVINDTTNETMHVFVRRTVGTKVSVVAIDDHHAYRSLGKMGTSTTP